MKNFIVVDDDTQWPGPIPGADLITAQDYLTQSSFASMRAASVYNLCDDYQYQRVGYYVSLLAEARGHKALPRARTLEDLQSTNWVRLLTEDFEALMQHALPDSGGVVQEHDFYFGQNACMQQDILGPQLFQLLQAPLLRLSFIFTAGRWQINAARALSLNQIDANGRPLVFEAAQRWFSGRQARGAKLAQARYAIAILHDPDNVQPPSNAGALQKFAQAADTLGMRTEVIGRADFARLSEFDGLFIRDTTRVNHYTYRFARHAAAEGLVVIDDPDSILKCSNKVYLAEMLAQRALPTPPTLVVHRANLAQVLPSLGLPCVLKQPDSAFSQGVVKVTNAAELMARAEIFFQTSDLFIAQAFLPTDFDWRVGVLDRRVLYVAKYFMAPGHWQIIKHQVTQPTEEGAAAALAIGEAPDDVIALAMRAAGAIGDGLYGVDIKQAGGQCYVIEVNDNPNLDAGIEDGVLKDALYREVMSVFLKRIEARRRTN